MRLWFLCLLVLLGCASPTGLRAAKALAHLDDPAQLLPADPAGVKALEARLAEFERTSGIRILVQFHAKSPSAEEDKVPGAYMSALSGKLGTLQRGVLVVYFADDPDWRIWIGDELTSTFAGKSGTVKELTDSRAIHDVKEILLASAHAKADSAFAVLQKAPPTNQAPSAALHLRLETDELLNVLMSSFASK